MHLLSLSAHSYPLATLMVLCTASCSLLLPGDLAHPYNLCLAVRLSIIN